jgi:hypothetical protein
MPNINIMSVPVTSLICIEGRCVLIVQWRTGLLCGMQAGRK